MSGGMRILVVGGGGREHALAWAISKSPLVERVYVTPGNGGIARSERFDVKETDLDGIVALALNEKIDLVVVGPEVPLVAGLVNKLGAAGVKAFGPSAEAALLEGSKIRMKNLCEACGIATARWMWVEGIFDDAREAIMTAARTWGRVPVMKADGLCAGKGVLVTDDLQEALDWAYETLVEKKFGDAGSRVVIEDRLYGRECSYMVFVDGENVIPLEPARDAKRLLDGDKGPNTGGMGAYSPLPDVGPEMEQEIMRRIIVPAVRGLSREGTPFQGLLYAGLMLTAKGPAVLEFNVRFGDPETQPLLMRLKSDIVPYLMGCTTVGGLVRLPPLEFSSQAAVCKVLASKGYPEKPETNYRIIDRVSYATEDTRIFHAGTRWDNGRGLVTSGGRVMNITSLGKDHVEARKRNEMCASDITFFGMQSRSDIALNP